jgi:hypothetical protein
MLVDSTASRLIAVWAPTQGERTTMRRAGNR